MFHLLFITFGVGMPLLIGLLEYMAIRTGDNKWRQTARAWSKVFVLLFITGAISGTMIAVQLGMVWSRFMAIAGPVMGFAFFSEGLAFYVEAAFLGLYMLTWDRLKGWAHLGLLIPVGIAASLSAFLITSVNAWMNAPQGFRLQNGLPVDVEPLRAMFNPALFTTYTHSLVGYFLTAAAAGAAYYAWRWLKRPAARTPHDAQVMGLMLGVMLVMAGLMGLTGDASAKYLAEYEPAKLAAAEALFTTTAGAPLTVGGVLVDGVWHGTIAIPNLLSWLATGNTNATITGLDQVPRSDWPPLQIHYFFDGMVAIGFALLGLVAVYWLLYWKRRKLTTSRPLLWALVAAAPLSMAALQLGWLVTEIGRQPYTIAGLLLTRDSITASQDVVRAAVIFPVLYILMLIVTIWVLVRWHQGKEHIS
jgi:cytochrome d ubiquinol oxidase subunit I